MQKMKIIRFACVRAGVRMCRRAGAQACRRSGVRAFRCAGVQAFRRAGVRACRRDLCSLRADLVVIIGAEVYGHEGQPDDACGVHGEAYVFRLVEVFRYLAGLESVQGAHQDQEHVINEGHHQ